MTTRLMLDSGAYSVWTKGASIDLESYIQFCQRYPQITTIVSLDVIPGKPRASVSSADVEKACEQSWRNFIHMRSRLGDKVLPVFHYKDDVKWLIKYLEAGCTYIGLGGLVMAPTSSRISFLKSIRKYLFKGDRPRVKLHGFGLTSLDVMKFWEWYSLDSTSWKQTGSWGNIYVPRKSKGEYDYHREPMVVGVSPISPSMKKNQQHVLSMSPLVKLETEAYLDHIGLPFGDWWLKPVKEGYSITRGSEEVWYSRKLWKILVPLQKGVATSFEMRCIANSRFVKSLNKALPNVTHIYFAGAPMPYPLETKLGRRLLSYYDVGKTGKVMDAHVATMRSDDVG